MLLLAGHKLLHAVLAVLKRGSVMFSFVCFVKTSDLAD